jgi:hypothetical protein
MVTVSVRLHRPEAAVIPAGRPGTDCTSADNAAWDAYAVIVGVAPDQLAGARILIDPNGWLRAVHWPTEPDGWHTTADLIAAIRQISTNPIRSATGDELAHHH